MWDDLVRGAIGAIVLVDTRRLARTASPRSTHFENSGLPYVIALNGFDGPAAVQPRRGPRGPPDRPRHPGSSRRTPATARTPSRH
ncbi:hypothetical protein ACRAWF_13295 [Streptomyces sp. L7]